MAFLESLTIAGKYTVTCWFTYWLGKFAYYIFLHPLKDYPGPFWAKLSDAYEGYHAVHRQLHLVQYRELQKYGLFSTPRRPSKVQQSELDHSGIIINYTDIYNNERVTKSTVYLVTLVTSGTINVFSALDHGVHRARRKLIGSAVSEQAMRKFEPTMSGQIDIFLRLILQSSQRGEAVDMSQRAKCLGMDIVGLLAFGHNFSTQTDEECRYLIEGMAAGNHMCNIMMHFPRLQSRFVAVPLHVLTYFKQQKMWRTFQHVIGTRVAAGKDASPDLYSQVADHMRDHPTLQLSDIWGEAMFFLPAGGDTTAITISSAFFYLSRNPQSYSRLAAEVRSTFTDAAEIRGGPKLFSCQYLRACIDEALRVSPPVGGTMWRQLDTKRAGGEPLVVDGHVIPPGTHVGVSVYALHHNEAYFPEPFAYKPERWLEANEKTKQRMNSAFAPFSTGYRGCAGKPMAYLEASLVIARVLWYFDFEIAPGELGKAGEGKAGAPLGRDREYEFQLYDIFNATHSGPQLTFVPREKYWEDLKEQ